MIDIKHARRFQIIETDSHGGDYPDEKFVNLPLMTEAEAVWLCRCINFVHCPRIESPRHWQMVEQGYKLQPGFEP